MTTPVELPFAETQRFYNAGYAAGVRAHARRKRWSLTRIPQPRWDMHTAILRVGPLTVSCGYSSWAWGFEIDINKHGFLVRVMRGVIRIKVDR